MAGVTVRRVVVLVLVVVGNTGQARQSRENDFKTVIFSSIARLAIV